MPVDAVLSPPFTGLSRERPPPRSRSVPRFYDAPAGSSHLIFDDWCVLGEGARRLLDCTCGIGTQAIGSRRAGTPFTRPT